MLERRDETHELFTFVTSSITGRRAVGNLIRHYDRMQKTDASAYPIVRLKIGGFQHRDDRIGWIKVPVIAVVGRAAKESAAKPDSSLAADSATRFRSDFPTTAPRQCGADFLEHCHAVRLLDAE